MTYSLIKLVAANEGVRTRVPPLFALVTLLDRIGNSEIAVILKEPGGLKDLAVESEIPSSPRRDAFSVPDVTRGGFFSRISS